jgi:hypothetical protein
MKDWTNLAAIAAAAIVVLAVVIVQPDGPALAVAGTLVGGCLAILQRRDVQ